MKAVSYIVKDQMNEKTYYFGPDEYPEALRTAINIEKATFVATRVERV